MPNDSRPQKEQAMPLIELADFGPAIFHQIASMWELEVARGAIVTRPCCDDATCGDEIEACTITLSRPGADPFVYETSWFPGEVEPDRFEPAWALRDATEHMMVAAELGLNEDIPEAFRRFCSAWDGRPPTLDSNRHLFAFAQAATALEFYVFPGHITAEAHGNG